MAGRKTRQSGIIARRQGRLPDALAYYKESLQMMSDLGDRQWEGKMHCNLGLLHHELKDDQEHM